MSSEDSFDPNSVNIWAIDDIEFWIGRGTADDIFAAVVEEYGDRERDEYPELVTDHELDSLKYFDQLDDDTGVADPAISHSFRHQLKIEIAAGVNSPRMFACLDF